MTFHNQQLNFMVFQAWKMKFLISLFSRFYDPYEPCIKEDFCTYFHLFCAASYIFLSLNSCKEKHYGS